MRMRRIGVVLEEKGGCLLSYYDVKTVLFVRNLTEEMKAGRWTNTSYQSQCLQDIFASIQRGEINGTALELKFMVLQVNQLKVRKFLSFLNYQHSRMLGISHLLYIFSLMKLLMNESQEYAIIDNCIRTHGKSA